MTARDVTGFCALFFRPEIGQFSPHFGATSLPNYTENLEKKGKIYWRKSNKKSSRERMQFFAYGWKLPAYSGAFLLTIDNFDPFTYNWSFFGYNFSFSTYSWSFFAYNGESASNKGLTDCKQRSLTVSKKAPTVSKKASPVEKFGKV